MRKFALVLTLASLMLFVLAGSAFATHYQENDTPGVNTDRGMAITSDNCGSCHENDNTRIGPHGGYTTTTDKCQTCHDIHGTAQNVVLLQGTTVTEACNYCHDLTTSNAGPYYSSGLGTADPDDPAYIPGGDKIKAAHRVVGIQVYRYKDTEDQWNTTILDGGVTSIPGGNDTDGTAGEVNNLTSTDRTPYLSGANMFTCDSCHTPHGFNVVNKYLGESQVKVYTAGLGGKTKIFATTRLLKQKPNKAALAVQEYGSKWCAQCHQGQDQFDQTNGVDFSPTYHNHPVNESSQAYLMLKFAWENTTDATKAQFVNRTADMNADIAAVLADGVVVVPDELTMDPRTNKQYAMVPATVFSSQYDANGNLVEVKKDGQDHADYTAYANYPTGPACQQCHGSARNLNLAFSLTNPARRSFPHISQNQGFLVEPGDDFCLNCHGPADLP